MNKLIKCLLIVSMLLSVVCSKDAGVRAETTEGGCKVREIVETGSEYSVEFVDFILDKEGLTYDQVDIEYYDDGLVNITYIDDNGDIIVYSPASEEGCSIENNSRSLIASSVFWAVVQLYNIYTTASGIYKCTCKILEMTGNGAVCDYITQELLSSISGTSAKYEIERIFYKDSTCPYPPNSQACSQPPYGYYKTYYKKVV